jgi:hypothetical protein
MDLFSVSLGVARIGSDARTTWPVIRGTRAVAGYVFVLNRSIDHSGKLSRGPTSRIGRALGASSRPVPHRVAWVVDPQGHRIRLRSELSQHLRVVATAAQRHGRRQQHRRTPRVTPITPTRCWFGQMTSSTSTRPTPVTGAWGGRVTTVGPATEVGFNRPCQWPACSGPRMHVPSRSDPTVRWRAFFP